MVVMVVLLSSQKIVREFHPSHNTAKKIEIVLWQNVQVFAKYHFYFAKTVI